MRTMTDQAKSMGEFAMKAATGVYAKELSHVVIAWGARPPHARAPWLADAPRASNWRRSLLCYFRSPRQSGWPEGCRGWWPHSLLSDSYRVAFGRKTDRPARSDGVRCPGRPEVAERGSNGRFWTHLRHAEP